MCNIKHMCYDQESTSPSLKKYIFLQKINHETRIYMSFYFLEGNSAILVDLLYIVIFINHIADFVSESYGFCQPVDPIFVSTSIIFLTMSTCEPRIHCHNLVTCRVITI